MKPVLGKQADTLWHMYLAEEEENKITIARDIEILAEIYLKDAALEKGQILLEPPLKTESNGQFPVGDIIYKKKRFHPLHLRQEDFLKQVGIFAITGEGKTNLAYLLALGLLDSEIPFMVIDWKRSWRNLLTVENKQLNKVQVFTIGRETLPFLWNVFRAPPGTDKEFWVGTIADALERSHLSGPGVAYYFNKIYSKVYRCIPDDFYPNFYDGLRELKDIKVFGREANWKQTALRIFQSFTLGKASKVFNARNPIKLENLLDKPVILELDLEMPKPLRMFFSEIILKWIHLYRLSKGETDKLKHVLFLEEVHNLFAQNNFYNDNKSIENLYREIRGFGQGIVSITQHPYLLPLELLGNCHTQIYLGLQHADDIRTARKSLFLTPEEDFYFDALKVGECIVKIKNRIDPCLVKTPLVPVKKELVTDEWLKIFHLSREFHRYSWKENKNYLDLKKDLSDLFGGKSLLSKNPVVPKKPFTEFLNLKLQEVPQKTGGYFPPDTYVQAGNTLNLGSNRGILSTAIIYDGNRKNDTALSSKDLLLLDIFKHPFSSTTKRYKRLNLHSKLGNDCRKKLIDESCILPRKITTGKGWITLFEITKKGKMLLSDLGFEFKNESEGIVHKFWKHKISEFYKTQGFDVRVEEYYVNGRPDIIVFNGDKKVAIEIETGKSDYVGNIERALEAGFDEVICMAVNRFVEERIVDKLKKVNSADGRVRVVCVKKLKV